VVGESVKDVPWAPPIGVVLNQLGGDPVVDPWHTGGIPSLPWPGNAYRILQVGLLEVAGEKG